MKFIGYVRVSSVGGRGGDSFRSPGDQAAAIRAYAKARDLDVEIFPPELDESGGRIDRPILQRAVDGVEAGKFAGIIVFDLSRYFRDVKGDLVTTERIEAAGGQVLSTMEHFEPGALGSFMRTTFGAMNQLQRQQASERFEGFRRSSAERGIWKFRQVPIGYRLAGDRPCGLVHSVDAARVKKAFAARKRGASTQAVAKILDMTGSGARAVLRNRVYLGEIHVGQHVNKSAHKPIVDVATFEAVQALRQVRPARGKGAISLLAGLARCAGCGHIMARSSSGRYGGNYYCKADHSERPCPDRCAISARALEAFVADAARAELEALKISTSRRTGDTNALRDALAIAKNELSAYLSATTAAGLPIESFAGGARERQDAVDAAQTGIDQHHTLSPIGGTFDTGAELWDDLEPHEKNQLLRGLMDAVVIRSAGRGKVLPVTERVRLFARGSLGDLTYRGGGQPMPVRAMPFPDINDERLIGMAGFQDRSGTLGR